MSSVTAIILPAMKVVLNNTHTTDNSIPIHLIEDQMMIQILLTAPSST